MKVIISPAKKMRQEDGIDYDGLPVFLEKTEVLMAYIQRLSYEEAKALWKCNDKIAALNIERFKYMSLKARLKI